MSEAKIVEMVHAMRGVLLAHEPSFGEALSATLVILEAVADSADKRSAVGAMLGKLAEQMRGAGKS